LRWSRLSPVKYRRALRTKGSPAQASRSAASRRKPARTRCALAAAHPARVTHRPTTALLISPSVQNILSALESSDSMSTR
jgi:hypothetical protein